jgi:acyl carrier protein
VHAAGIAGGGLIALKTAPAAAAVLRAKVAGTRALLDALASEETGEAHPFVVLFSSVASLTGGVGQVDYAAANAYLDAAAHAAAADGRRVVSIDWDAWQEVGMAAGTSLPASMQAGRDRLLAGGIPPEDGIEAFFRVVASPFAQVVVSPRGIAERDSETDSVAPLPIDRSAGTPHHRPDLSTHYAEPRTSEERQLAEIWRGLLGTDGIGRDDNFFELGGDSLLATQLTVRLRAAFGRECSLRQVVEHATIAGLAALLFTPTASTNPQAALLDELASMTEEEAEARLQALLSARGEA